MHHPFQPRRLVVPPSQGGWSATGAGRRAIDVVDRGDDGVEQAGVVAIAVERAEAREERLCVLPPQILRPRDAEAEELPGDRRADLGKGPQLLLAHAPRVPDQGATVLNKSATAEAGIESSSRWRGATPASARVSRVMCGWSA